jgi:hypothetical protein
VVVTDHAMYKSGLLILYSGDLVLGRMHGVGSYTYMQAPLKGEAYRGRLERGNEHGTGLYSYPSGATYEGAWDQGLRHGYGVETDERGEPVYDGNWVHGGRAPGSANAQSGAQRT